MRTTTRSLALAAALVASGAPAWSLAPGDLMFTSFNADEDGWSLVATVDLPANTLVYFTDNEWNGSNAFNSGEGYHQWSTGGSVIAAGSTVRFSATDSATLLAASTGTLSRASVSGSSSPNLSQTGDTLYAYLGSSVTAPTLFLTAVSSAGFSATEGTLAGTGLAAGVNALDLPLGADYAEYTGPRAGLAWDVIRQQLASPGQWQASVDGSFAATAPSLQTFAATPVPEPGAVVLALAGAAVLSRSGRRNAPGRAR